jgi:hypothetical protein
MEKVKRVNVNINHGDAYFSDSVTVADNPERFIFDFKQSSPRFDQVAPNNPDQQTTIVMKHNTIVVSAALAKVLHEMLGERIKQHEKMFGKIAKPTKKKQAPITSTTVKPSYFG